MGAAEIALEHAAKLSVQVTLESGSPAADYQVSLLVRLDGFATTFTAMTNRRGEASFRRVPSGCALVPRVSLGDDVAVPFDAITLAPLEQGTLALQLED